MEFCPKCGGLLLPKRDGDKIYLKCRECDYIKEVSPEEIESDPDYKMYTKIEHSPREKIIIGEEEESRIDTETEDEKEERRKAILDMMMESMDSD